MEVALMRDDLLNFTLDAGHDDDDDEKPLKAPSSSSSLESSKPNNQDPDDHQSLPLPEFAEEELEWLSNKDAFPALETCFDILGDHPGSNHQSPVSVLENSASTSNGSTVTSCCGGSILVSVRYPVKARSKKRRRHRRGFPDLLGQQRWWWSQANIMSAKKKLQTAPPPPSATRIGRRCQHCLAENTQQWRAGPLGPKTLCNACGVQYKSGRLVPEYRPASSPTFSSSSTAPPSRRRYRLPSNTSTSLAPYSPTSRRILIFNLFFFFLFLGLSLVLTEAAGSCSLSSH